MPAGYGALLAQQLGTQAASQGLGGLMDMAFQGWRNQNQLNQNQRLMEQQIRGQKEMGKFNIEQQMELWNRTNAAAQMQHYKKAGLNPALMYGTSGAGGSTAAATGSVTAGTADPRAGGIHTGMNIMMPAQLELLRAQARNLDADTAKKSGVETDLGRTTIEQLKAQTSNIKVQTAIAEIDKTIKEITQEDVTDIASLNAQKLQQEVFIIKNAADISDATKQTIIKTVGQEYINKVLEGIAIKSGIQVNEAQIRKMTADILQGWNRLSLEERQTAVQELMGGEQKDQDQILGTINSIAKTVTDWLIFRKLFGKQGPTEIKGFRR